MTEQPVPKIQTIAIVGGTGKEGKGLAYRWAKAGYRMIIGSRQLEKAQAAAAELSALLGETGKVEGMENPRGRQPGRPGGNHRALYGTPSHPGGTCKRIARENRGRCDGTVGAAESHAGADAACRQRCPGSPGNPR